MRTAEIEMSLNAYQEVFTGFRDMHQLPDEWFGSPDHFAIKCTSLEDYRQTVDTLSPGFVSDSLWEISMDDRILGAAKLNGKVALSDSEFGWIEIMQPRPGKEPDEAFVEHTEFYFPDFYVVQKWLDRAGVDYEMQGNEGHRWVNLVMDSVGREIKINDKPLPEVIEEEKRLAKENATGPSNVVDMEQYKNGD